MTESEFYLNILNQLNDGIYFVDKNRTIKFWNKGAERITGYSSAEIVNKTCNISGLNHIDTKGKPLCQLGCPLYATITDGKQRKEQVFVRHKDGYRIPIWVNVFPVYENNEITGAVEVFTRNSPTVYQDNLVEKLTDIAMYDQLTGFPNRRYTENFLSHKLQEYHHFGKLFAVLFADIDNFSTFNNTYGHDNGDLVLKSVAKTLMNNIRRNDLVGRWGGEEILGIYTISDKKECNIIGERFRYLVEKTTINYNEKMLNATVSVGITCVKSDDDIETIVKRADDLMYKAKRTGKNQVVTDINC